MLLLGVPVLNWFWKASLGPFPREFYVPMEEDFFGPRRGGVRTGAGTNRNRADTYEVANLSRFK